MARPKILVFQHVPYEPLGTLDPLLKRAGFRIRYINFGREPESRPRLDGYEALIILGGSVSRNATREIGWYDVALTPDGACDPVLSTFDSVQQVFQWHEDGIQLPPGIVHLASSDASSVQAFRHGEHIYGFQFHLEANRSLIERWLTVPANQLVLQDEAGCIDPDVIRTQTSKLVSDLEELSQATFSRWIDRFEMGVRQHRLPSR
jgi:GMP synthase (glutamine-hydrolysing)